VVSYRTIDRVVQEDARLVSFNGKGLGHVEINDNFPFDLRGYYQAKSSISLLVQIDKAFPHEVNQAINQVGTQAVYLSMRCEKDCGADIDISSALSTIEVGTWQPISVDLACFANKGATMDKIFAPFVVKTRGVFTFKYSDVKIIPNSAQQATYSCQNE
ncbi:MAG: glycoside hydrolase family 3 protein, partial [Alteromonadaceae bacterium]|nr:glycoside hydrolase family 3 protein [Alteromonadaceae bacterium]